MTPICLETILYASVHVTCRVTLLESYTFVFSLQIENVAKSILAVAEGKARPLWSSKEMQSLFQTITANKTDDCLRPFATDVKGAFCQPDKVTAEAIPSGQKLRVSHDAKIGWRIHQAAKRAVIAQGTILFKASGVLTCSKYSKMATGVSQDVCADTPKGVPVATQCELVHRQGSGWARVLNPLGLCGDDGVNYLLLDCHDVGGMNRYDSHLVTSDVTYAPCTIMSFNFIFMCVQNYVVFG
jgi:hypothetical protein